MVRAESIGSFNFECEFFEVLKFELENFQATRHASGNAVKW